MRYFTLLLALFLAGCGAYSANVPSIKPYKMDIQQGNAVTPKMMLQLRPGMNKSQVRFIMGTPLLTDTFHADRWDYFYQLQKQGKVMETRRIVLTFEDDKLKSVRGDVIPTDKEGVVTVEPVIMPKSGTLNPKDSDKGLLDKLKFWGDDDKKPEDGKPEEPKVEPAKVPEIKPEAKPEMKPDPVKEEVKTEPAPKPDEKEEKGLLDKLKFWKSDDKPVLPAQELKPEAKPEHRPEPKPEPVIEFKPEPKPESLPEPIKMDVKPEPIVKPVEKEEKGLLDKLKFWGDDEPSAPKVAPAPEVKPEPKLEFKPEVKAEPEPEVVKPAPKPPVVADKPIPKPSKDLPAEDAPDYFEKMLEKIGF